MNEFYCPCCGSTDVHIDGQKHCYECGETSWVSGLEAQHYYAKEATDNAVREGRWHFGYDYQEDR